MTREHTVDDLPVTDARPPGSLAAPGGGPARASAADPAALRALRWILASGAVVIGVVGLLLDGRPEDLPVVVTYAAAMTLSLWVSRGRHDLRPWLAVDGGIAVVAIVATGGPVSPLLLALLGPMLLAGILRSVLVTGLLLVASAPTLFVAERPVQGASVFGVLAIAAIIGSSAERLLAPRRERDAALSAATAEHDRVQRMSELLGTLEASLTDGHLATTPRGRLLSVRRWASLVDEPDVIASRAGSGHDVAWQVLGADDELRPAPLTELPAALLDAGAFRAVTLLPEIAMGAGVDPTSRRAAYLWLSHGDAAVEVVALEWPLPRSFPPDERRFLEQLHALFDLHRATGVQLHRLHDRTERSERSSLAASLHDDLAQDLVYAAMEVDRAARRHPDDAALAALSPVIRGAIGTVRSTITGLRHDAGRSGRSVADQLVDVLDGRATVVSSAPSSEREERWRPEVAEVVVDVVSRCVELARDGGARAVTVHDHSVDAPHVLVEAELADGDPVVLPAELTARVDAVGMRLSVTSVPGGVTSYVLEGGAGGDHGAAGGRPPPAA